MGVFAHWPAGRGAAHRHEARRALSDHRADPYISAHQSAEALADRQPEPSSAMHPGDRGIGLGERLKEAIDLFARNTGTGVLDGESPLP